jgi:hypothetical protein
MGWLDRQFAGFCRDESVISEEVCEIVYILHDRQDAIREVLGIEVTRVAIREAFSEFTTGMDPRLVEGFTAYIRER